MPKPANKNVRNMFASAQTGHLQSQLQERDDEIAALKDQIENLKHGALAEASGVQHYPIEQFVPLRLPDGLTQPRRFFDADSLEKLKQSIQSVGIQEPLLVRHGDDDKLEIISGERRWRCSKELGLSELPAIEKDLNDQEALEIALVANLMREDLNIVDETDSIVSLIALRLNLDREQIPKILFKIKNLRSRKQLSDPDIAQELHNNDVENSRILSPDSIQEIDAILGEFGITLESFVANRLSALAKMSDALLEIVRQGQLDFSKADVIRRANLPEDLEAGFIQDAINQGLTKAAILDKVKQVKTVQTDAPEIDALYKKLRSKPTWKKIEARPKLKKKVEKLEALLNEILSSLE